MSQHRNTYLTSLTRAFIKLTHKQPHLTSASWIYSKFTCYPFSYHLMTSGFFSLNKSENILDRTFAKHFSTNQILVIHRRVRKAVQALRFISTKYLKNMQRCTIKLLVQELKLNAPVQIVAPVVSLNVISSTHTDVLRKILQ